MLFGLSWRLRVPHEGTDEQLLDEIQRASFDFFWNEASPKTGQVKDRALANGNDSHTMSSIAATGFGLTSLSIGRLGTVAVTGRSPEILDRVRTTLRFLANDLHNEHGVFFHFIDMETGERWASSIDSSILLCGVLTARQYFVDPEIRDLFCLSLHDRFLDYSENLCGVNASDDVKGYTAWGAPNAEGDPIGPVDGSMVPCTAGGFLAFLFDDWIRVLRNLRGPYREKVWTKYNFRDAFNPLTNWYDTDVLGIDFWITMLMAENHRTGFVWEQFMKNPEAQKAMQLAGFRAACFMTRDPGFISLRYRRPNSVDDDNRPGFL
jgi:hypothetical protein